MEGKEEEFPALGEGQDPSEAINQIPIGIMANTSDVQVICVWQSPMRLR